MAEEADQAEWRVDEHEQNISSVQAVCDRSGPTLADAGSQRSAERGRVSLRAIKAPREGVTLSIVQEPYTGEDGFFALLIVVEA